MIDTRSAPHRRLAFGLAFLLLPALPVQATESPEQWFEDGQSWVGLRAERTGLPEARNVILFVGDGMSLATVAAARILEGQQRGETGEENLLSFERFPQVALSKTYNTNQQTPDSAGTMTAMVTGVKTYAGALAVTDRSRRADCASIAGHELVTALDLATLANMATGIVTTTRITHATPAALFARVPERGWEVNRSLPSEAVEAGCTDIAHQLVHYPYKHGIDVVLGGGRRAFLPSDHADPEYPAQSGLRDDGLNLIELWQQRFPNGRYIWNSEQFLAINPDFSGPVLGLFEPSHMQYEADRDNDPAGEPSIEAMTVKAIELLSQRKEGYFLMVEGGRIDHAHHANNAHRALTDTIAFSDAIRSAAAMTDEEDTLIIVTADHAHALNFGGYGQRGNPITGLVIRPGDGPVANRMQTDNDDQPMTVLSYSSGPGHRPGARPALTEPEVTDPDFKQEAVFGTFSATHAGEDVPVYAIGPGSEWVNGVMEQNVIFHIMVNSSPALRGALSQLQQASGQALPRWSNAKSSLGQYPPEG